MAVTYGFFNSVNGDRKYDADQMADYFRGIVNEGVFQHLDGGLAVSAGTGLAVSVAAGRAIIQNRWVQNSAALSLSIAAASETYGRKDAVVIRYNISARSVSITVKTGTPAASPAAPSLTRNSTTYEMALAYVNVSAGATSVTVTDKRSDTTVCGWVSVAQSTSGEVDAQLNALKTGFDGVSYPSPAAMVTSCDQKLQNEFSTIYSNEMTKTESASGWYIYPYTVKAGLTYTFKNISESASTISFRTRYTEQGSTIDSYDGITKGNEYTFVASGDANYLRVNYTATGTFKIICKETISEIYNYIDSFDIDDIKNEIIHTFSATKPEAGRVAYRFSIVNGHRYVLKNTSTSAALVASTRSSEQSSTNIQVITEGMTAGKSILFTATADAPVVSVYTDGAGSFTIYDYDTIRADIDKKGNSFLPYQEGYISFTVPVNQTIPDISDTSASTVDSEVIVNVDCILKLPTSYSQGGTPTKLLMICHGASHGVSGEGNWTTNGSYNQMINEFVGAGYAIFDCNGYDNTENGHDFWGAPRGVEAWRKAYQYIVDNYNVEKQFCIYAFSMGALTALCLAFHGFPNIKAIGLGSCVLRLDLCATESSMRLAYGITGESYDASKCIGSNPFAHLLTIDSTEICDYPLPPIKIWYGSTETGSTPYVNKSYASQFVNAIVNGGNFAQYREVAGAGHSMSYGNLTAINKEFVYWFNRFND